LSTKICGAGMPAFEPVNCGRSAIGWFPFVSARDRFAETVPDQTAGRN
jgi:hypothetical protein